MGTSPATAIGTTPLAVGGSATFNLSNGNTITVVGVTPPLTASRPPAAEPTAWYYSSDLGGILQDRLHRRST